MELVANTVGPVFAVIGLGYLLAGRRAFDLATLSDLAIFLTSPALMFSVLSGTDFVAETWAALAGGIALAVSDTTLPRIVMEPIEMLADMAIPVLLLTLGNQLRTFRIVDLKPSAAAVAILDGGAGSRSRGAAARRSRWAGSNARSCCSRV